MHIPVSKLDDNLWESVSFHHMGSEGETQVVRLSVKCSYLLSHLSPIFFKH